MYGVLAAAGPSFVLHLLVAAGAALIVLAVKLVRKFKHA